MKKELVIPAAVVGGVFGVILLGAGVWTLTGHVNSNDNAVLTELQQQQAAAIAASSQSQQSAQSGTQSMDQTTSNAPMYEITPGLEAQDVTEGTGAAVIAGQTVAVKYTGMLENGKVFDSSDAHGGQPFSFTLGGHEVIEGWDIGVVGMKPGGVRMLTIAPQLAYGDREVGGGVIPANSTLVFRVEMIGPVQ